MAFFHILERPALAKAYQVRTISGQPVGHHHHQTHHRQLHNHDMHIITIIIDTTLNQNFWKFSYHTITQHQIFMPSLPKEKDKTTHLSLHYLMLFSKSKAPKIASGSTAVNWEASGQC